MELAISILGYITQFTQVMGWRINLLLGTFLFSSLSAFTFTEGLYANSIIRAIAAAMCLLGFFKWKTVIYFFKKWHLIPFLLVVLVVAFIQVRFTNNPLPLLDTAVASMGLIATFLMAVRSIYCWSFLMILNGLEVIMFSMVHNYYLALMQLVYMLTSVIGIIVWKKRKVDRSLST